MLLVCLHLCHVSLWACRHLMIRTLTVSRTPLPAAWNTVCHWDAVTVDAVFLMTHTAAVMLPLIWIMLISRFTLCRRVMINCWWWTSMASCLLCVTCRHNCQFFQQNYVLCIWHCAYLDLKKVLSPIFCGFCFLVCYCTKHYKVPAVSGVEKASWPIWHFVPATQPRCFVPYALPWLTSTDTRHKMHVVWCVLWYKIVSYVLLF